MLKAAKKQKKEEPPACSPSGDRFQCGSAFPAPHDILLIRFSGLLTLGGLLEDSPQDFLQIGEEVAAAYLFHRVHIQFMVLHFRILLPYWLHSFFCPAFHSEHLFIRQDLPRWQ
jgi:hypothetical protein